MTDIKKFLKEKYGLLILIAIFIFSFTLDIYVLTRYSLSYGIDGAFYDIQVRNILQHAFPMSNDPPLAYYLLTPFAVLSGNSFLGIKIGMAFMGSLLAFPAYLLTECYTKDRNIGSKIPALLSAFLITVNVNYFALIGDFMQNLVGVLFLAIFLYFAINWFENINDWKKYGTLTVIFLCLNLLTHIYTGALAVILFFGLLIFSIILKTYKTRKLPIFDLKILGLLSALVIAFLVTLFVVYPVMYTKYGTVISFFNSSTTEAGGMAMSNPVSGIIFCSLPYLFGVLASLILLYRGLKEKLPQEDQFRINKNTLLSCVYVVLAAVLAILAVIPSDQYQSRFILMAFVPIALLVPFGIKFLEIEFLSRYPSTKKATTLLVLAFVCVFAFSSFYTASESFNNLGPTVTTDQYNELVEIKASFENVTDQNIVIIASDFQNKYWVEYVLGDMGNGNNVTVMENLQEIQGQTGEKYQNTTIYAVSTQNNKTSSLQGISNTPASNPSKVTGSDPDNSHSLSILLPYGPSLLPNSIDNVNLVNGGSKTTPGPMNGMHQNSGNMTGDNNVMHGNMTPGNMTSNQNGPPGNSTNIQNGPQGNMTPGNMTNLENGLQGNMTSNTNLPQGVPGNNMGVGSDNQKLQIESLISSGTTIFSGNYFKIVKIQI